LSTEKKAEKEKKFFDGEKCETQKSNKKSVFAQQNVIEFNMLAPAQI
jgi:hypothetical protein